MNTDERLMNFGVSMDGRYKCIIHNLKGESRVVADWFDNLILDSGLNRLGEGGVVNVCQVGASSSAPAVGQSSLLSPIAITSTEQGLNYGTADDGTYVYFRKTFRFGIGVAAGNLSEVGVGWQENFMFSRALIKDDNSDPTTITVLPDEVLDVVYEVRFYQTLTDRTSVVTISGVDHDFTFRPIGLSGNNVNLVFAEHACVQFYYLMVNGCTSAIANPFSISMRSFASDFAMVAVTNTSPLGTIVSSTPGSDRSSEFRNAYVSNTYERKIRATFGLNCYEAGKGEEAHHGYLLYTRCGNYQVDVDPPIPKTDRKVLTLDYTVSWSRR